MICIVAAHGLNNRSESHRAALWVSDRFAVPLGRKRPDKSQVPVAHRVEGCERFAGAVGAVMGGPSLLIEGLDRVMVLAKSLPQAKAKGQLAVGKMTDDFAGAPFTGSGRLVDAF